MDESEKRKERLNAMRLEAARATDFESPGLAPGALSNPLIENETASAYPQQYNTLPRFDYYTDPMSAFSGSKRRNNVSPQVTQGDYNTPPRPVDQGMIPNPAYHYPAMNSPGQRMFSEPRANFQGPVGSPMGAAYPLNRPQQNPPSYWVGSGAGASNYGMPPNLSRGGNLPSPSFGQGGSPYVDYGRGRGPQGHYDPGRGRGHYDPGRGRGYYDLGRGRGHYDPGRGRGRGRSHGNRMGAVDSESGPESYYMKEMVEDPWLGLNPVMWKGVGDKSWLPKSIAMKKLKSSPAPQQSLAEYLASTFDDFVDDAVEDEKGT